MRECVTVLYVILSLFNKCFRHENRHWAKKVCQSKPSYFFLQKMVGSRKIMKIQGKLEGVIKESRIEGLAGIYVFLNLIFCKYY